MDGDYTEEQLEEFVRKQDKFLRLLFNDYGGPINTRKQYIKQCHQNGNQSLFFLPQCHTYKKSDPTLIISLFVLLNGKRLPYFKFDLVDNKMAQNWVKDQLNHFQLPFVKIHGHFIGTYEDFVKLYELDFISQIIKKVYLEKCLICEKPRENKDVNAKCEKCDKPYLFFHKAVAHQQNK